MSTSILSTSSARDVHRRVSLRELITDHSAMQEVLDSGRVSESPDRPLLLNEREDGLGLEIADGHHRVAQAIREGRTEMEAIIDSEPDDEPYEGPFYDFAQHC